MQLLRSAEGAAGAAEAPDVLELVSVMLAVVSGGVRLASESFAVP